VSVLLLENRPRSPRCEARGTEFVVASVGDRRAFAGGGVAPQSRAEQLAPDVVLVTEGEHDPQSLEHPQDLPGDVGLPGLLHHQPVGAGRRLRCHPAEALERLSLGGGEPVGGL